MNATAIAATYCPTFLRPAFRRFGESTTASRLARGLFWSLGGAVVSRGMSLCATVLTARILGRTVYGELGIISSTVGMFGVLAGFGFGVTATKYVAEFRQSDPVRAGRIIGLSGLFTFVTSGLMALGLIILAPWLAAHTINAPHLANTIRIAALILFVSGINGAQTGALSGFEAFKSIAFVNFLTGLISFPLIVYGAWYGGLPGTVCAMGINLVCNWLLNHLALRREARRNGVPFTMKGCFRECNVLWKFSLPSVLTGCVNTPIVWLGNAFLVNYPNGFREFGLYSAIEYLYWPFLMITANISSVYLPILSNAAGNGNSQQLRVQAKRMLTANGVAVLFLACLFLALSPILLSFFGRDFEYRVSLVAIITVVVSLRSFGGYLNSVLLATQQPWYGFCGNVLWAAIFLPMQYCMASYGADGLALSHLTALLIAQIAIGCVIYQRVYRSFPQQN